jgi:hypothetical protein
MMWMAIAPDEPHPCVPTRTGVVTKAASVPFYASEFVLLASRQRNRTTDWLKKMLPHLIASMTYRNCHAVSVVRCFDEMPKMVS